MIDNDVKNTIINDINKVINKIKKCKSKSMYNIYLYELEALYYLCNNLGIEDYPKIENYSSKSYEVNDDKLMKKYMKQLLKDKKYHLEFSNNEKIIDIEKSKNELNYVIDNNINMDQIIEIMLEFLKDYDIELYNIFVKLYNENRIIINNTENYDCTSELLTPAYTINSYGTFTPYMVINYTDDLDDSVNIVHELGHIYDYIQVRSNKINMQKKMNCLDEVISYYLQFVYTDYLSKKKIFDKNIDNLYYGYSAPYIEYIGKIKEEYSILDKYNIYDSYIDEYLNYTYGVAIAYHFLEKYKVDPEKTKNDINNFIMLNGQYNMMEMLDIFNLKEELLDSKILKKYLG